MKKDPCVQMTDAEEAFILHVACGRIYFDRTEDAYFGIAADKTHVFLGNSRKSVTEFLGSCPSTYDW